MFQFIAVVVRRIRVSIFPVIEGLCLKWHISL